MPPKPTESDRFKQAIQKGKSAALNTNSQDTAAPTKDESATLPAAVHGRTKALMDEEQGEDFQTPYGSGNGKQPYGSGDGKQPCGSGDGKQPYGSGDGKQPYGSGDGKQPYGSGDGKQPYGSGDGKQPYGSGDGKQPYGSGEQKPYGSGTGIVGGLHGSGNTDERLNAFETRMAAQMQVQTDILQTMQSMFSMFIQQQIGAGTPTKVQTFPDPFAPRKLDFKEEPKTQEEEKAEEDGKTLTAKEEIKEKVTEMPTENRVVREVKDHRDLLKLVPTYDGNDAESLLQFFDTFEIYLTHARQCSDFVPGEAFYQATGRLKGDAWSEWRLNGSTLCDWEDLKVFLTERFVSRQHILDLESAIHTVKQGRRPTKDYIAWFQKTARQLNQFDCSIGEGSSAIGIFLRGIGNEQLLAMLKGTLSTRPNAKLIEVLNLARELGTIYDEKKGALTTESKDRPPCAICKRRNHFTETCWEVEANKPDWLKQKEKRQNEDTSNPTDEHQEFRIY